MPEPIDPVLRCPMGGWPKVAVRVELVGVTTLADAAYQLAGMARANRLGFVAIFKARDLYAYPHQSTAEIERGYQRMRDMELAGQCVAPAAGIERWTARRKVGLVMAVAEGFVQRLDALAHYALSDEELSGWEDRYQAFGRPGLAQGKLQALPRLSLSPPAEDAA